MRNNRIIHFSIHFLFFVLLTSISSCGLIDINGDGGDELTWHDRHLLRIKSQLVGTWDIQFMSIDDLGYDSPLETFSKTLEGKGYRIVFNADNTMQYYRDGYPANKGSYEIDDYFIICYTEDYYDMYIQYEIEDIQSDYLKETKYSYRNGNSTMANGRITLQKTTIN